MAFTQADLDAIDEEIRKVRTVKSQTFSDQQITYRDLDELYKERDRIARAIAGGNRTRYAATSKGV